MHDAAAPELFYDPTSEPSRAVHWFALEAGLPLTLRYTWLTRDEHLSGELPQVNPRRQVPALRHGDVNLSEATAIITYLAEINGGTLGETPAQRARVNQIFSWYHLGLRKPLTDYYLPALLLPAQMGDEAPSDVSALRDGVKNVFVNVERFLDDALFVCGDEPTAADLLLASDIFCLDCDPERATYAMGFTRLEAWLGRLRKSPHYHASHLAWNAVAPMIREHLLAGGAPKGTAPEWMAQACERALGLASV